MENETDKGNEKKRSRDAMSEDESEGSNDMDIVNVDFEFFDPKEIDFHAIKRMLIQHFGDDHELFEISELTDMIVAQKLIGSTVKVTGEDDPYAFMTVLNLQEYKDKKVIQQLKSYLAEKSSKSNKEKHEKFCKIISDDAELDAAILISERLTNMPAQIVPPMIRMLVEEIEWAIQDKERYNFEWYILLSPVYKEIAPTKDVDEAEEMPGQVSSRQGKKSRVAQQVFYFHPEDEFIQEYAEISFDIKFSTSKRAPESRNSFSEFGLAPFRKCLVIHKSKLLEVYQRLEKVFSPS